jgi:hypothetical protein
VLALLLLTSSALFACTCSSDSSNTPGSGGGGDAGPDGSTDAGSDAPPDARPDALPDAIADASGMKVVPEWETMTGKVAGCEIQKLVNSAQLRLFEWEPCDGIDGCERTKTNKNVFSDAYGAGWMGTSVVRDDDGVTRLGLVTGDPTQSSMAVYYATDDGQALGGYRPLGSDLCVPATAIRGARRATSVVVRPEGKPFLSGGMLDTFDGAPPVLFDLPSGQMGSPTPEVLGDERWVWDWVMPERLTSVSASDGGDFREIVKVQYDGPLVKVGNLVTTGPLFLFSELFVDQDAGTVTRIIASSDGVAAPEPYLVPSDDSFFLFPGFAGTHVGWIRGIHPTDTNAFERVEMWAAAYSPNPAELQPYMIEALPYGFGAGSYAAAHGKYAAVYPVDSETWTHEIIWDLATKAKQVIDIGPNVVVRSHYGLTKEYVWLGTAPPHSAADKWMMRLKLE